MTRSAFLTVLLLMIVPAAFGQALPAAEGAPISTGFALPRAAGTLQYAVSAAETLSWGYYSNSGVSSSTILNGDLAYLSISKNFPFSAVLAGGRSWANSGQPSYSFVNLGMSQVANIGRWNFVFSDSVSYLPGTPTTGVAGVTGLGDIGVTPVQNNGQGVLTNYSSRVQNTVSGSLQREVTGKTSVYGSGSYGIVRFLNDSAAYAALDNNSISGSGGFTHHLNVRNNFGGSYTYSTYTFAGHNVSTAPPGFTSQTASFSYSHQFTRKVGMSFSAGPQWSKIDFGGTGQSLSVFASAGATYAAERSNLSLSYVRSTNSGFGVVGGSLSDSVLFTATKTFGRVWNASGTAAFTRSASLPSQFVVPYTSYTTLAGGQLSRALVRNLSAYGSFTIANQSNKGSSNAVDLFSGVSQTLAFGLTYSPSTIHIGRP